MDGGQGKPDPFPACWSDDERMSYLFSDFRQNRTVNPNDWDNKLKFWSQLIAGCCGSDRCAVVDCDRVVEKFRRKGRLPLGMNRVLREMANNGELVREDDFISNLDSSWMSWGVHHLVRRPLTWAVSSIFKRSEQNLSGSYILMSVLKEISQSILDARRGNEENLVELTTLRGACSDVCNDERTFHLALMYLQKMKQVHVETIADDVKIVKFVSKNQPTVSPPTEAELGTFSLSRTIESLKLQIEQHGIEITKLHTEAVLTVRKGFKSSAKNILRRKKLLEKKRERKETTLDTLQQLLDKLQGAETDSMTLEAYRAGACALKQTLKTHGLTPEAVDESMSEVQEVMELCAEIDDAIFHGNKVIDETVSFNAGVDVKLLEDELANLLEDEETNDTKSPSLREINLEGGSLPSSALEKDVLDDFPKIPQTVPHGYSPASSSRPADKLSY